MAELKEEAKLLFDNGRHDSAGHRGDGNSRWTQMMIKSGTLADRIAALTMAVKRSPRSGMTSFDTLVKMLQKKSRREVLLALEALSALLKEHLLPSDRKLIRFEARPVSELLAKTRSEREELLVEWYLEDLIKNRYGNFLMQLETLLKDQVESTRLKVLGVVFDLLVEKPEREDRLLELIVNKLGDPEKAVASKACWFLVRLIQSHPNMKLVVVDEVERLLYRTNVSPKAQYYAICFLIQIKLNASDTGLSVRLVKIYFALFKAITSKKAANPKMMSAILTGVNRTYPFTRGPQDLLEHIDTFFRYIHTVSAQIGIQLLMLLYQVMEREGAITDRFYMALYRKMLDPELLNHPGRSSSLLNLLYKAMKRDVEPNRIKAFMKRMLQLGMTHSPPFLCGTLVVISEVLKEKPRNFVHQLLTNTTVKTEPAGSSKTERKRMRVNTSGEDGDEKTENERKSPRDEYTPMTRNPLFCGAEFTYLWELQILRRHYHPSVSRFSECILLNKPINYAGDPFEDFTSIHFLDRFVYRNPKKASGGDDSIPDAKKMSVLSEQYLALPEKSVPDDEKFLHRYLTQRLRLKKEAAGHDESDIESVSDGEFEQFLDDYERNQDDVDLDLDFAGDLQEDQEQAGSDDEFSFGDAEDDSDDEKEFSAGEEDALNAAFASADEDDSDEDVDVKTDHDDDMDS